MDYNTESGIDTSPEMNSSTVDFSSPERLTTTTKLTPRALVYDDVDGDEMPSMIRRRTINAFAKNNNNNDDGDKLSLEDEDETSNLNIISKYTLRLLIKSSLIDILFISFYNFIFKGTQ